MISPLGPSSSDAPSIAVRDARIVFGTRIIADGLTIDFPAGETTCLIGRSGVGKTSLLRWLAGLLPGTGPIGPVAYMAQQDLLLPWLSVLENVLLGYRLREDAAGGREARSRARQLLADVGLADREDDLPASLSGGMRQRAALARTLCEDRPIVLMDEPFSHLDAVTRYELQDLSARMLAARTAILVTHDPLEALRIGHHVRVLSGPPLRIGSMLQPPGHPPRNAADPILLSLQARLIDELRGAAEK